MRVLAALLLVVLTACGSAASSDDRGGSFGGAFPVTIEHKYGETTITEAPKRIVTVGLNEQDALLALGVVPVGTTKWVGGYDGAIGPWAADKVGDTPMPKVLDGTDGVDIAAVTRLKPDLILAVYSALTKEEYETLSKLAPVVAQPVGNDDYGVPWQQNTRIVGEAIGKAAEADALVRKVEGQFAAIKRKHPDFAKQTGLCAMPYEGYFIYGEGDPRATVLMSLGLPQPDGINEVTGDRYGASISIERADALDVGALVWFVKGDQVDQLHSTSVYAGLDVVTQGREVFVDIDTDYGASWGYSTVLSLPYLLERLEPQLVAALDGDPSTKVPTDFG